jgi:hypothetical protein
MTETKTNPIVRLLPSLTDVAFLLPVILLFAGLRGVRTLLGDGDTGWHVRIGEWILAHGQVPRQDMFSFTKPGQPFFAWEWLWDVGAAWLHQRWGMQAVVLASLLVIALTTVLLYRLVFRRCGNPLVSIALTGLASAAASVHWLARPHLVTMLMMMVFLTLLERVREGHTAWLWSLPVLTILWTNLHGGFPIGIVIVGAYGAGELLRAAVTRDSEERRASLRAAGPYLAAAAGCALASLVNPYGYQLHVHMLEYFKDPFQLKYIQEFRSADFHSPPAIFLEIMLILGLCAAIWYGRRKQFAEVLLIAGFGHLSLVMARNMPIYTLAAAPIVAVPLVAWLKALAEGPVAGWIRAAAGTFVEMGEELVPLERPWRMHVVPTVVMLLLVAGMESPMAGIKLKAEYDPNDYPEKALAALNPAWLNPAGLVASTPAAFRTGGDSPVHMAAVAEPPVVLNKLSEPNQLFEPNQRIFTHDEWGDYLIYKLSPRGFKVFVDGRSDFYGGKFGQDYIDVLEVKHNWQQTLDRYGVDTILLPCDAALTGALKESRRWRVAYDDGMAIVFRPAALAGARMQQVFTGITGGIGGGDPEITSVKTRILRDRLIKLEDN